MSPLISINGGDYLYQVSLVNNGVETIIHSVSSDKDAPHLKSLPLKEGLSQIESLSFSLMINHPSYNDLHEFTSKIRVINNLDGSIVFEGRVLNLLPEMQSNGIFIKNVICEGALGYLNDSNVERITYINQTPTQIITDLLSKHNSLVDNDRKIYLGVVQLTQPITIFGNYESTYEFIIKNLVNILGGDIRVQKRNGTLYLDYLTSQGNNNGAEIRLGFNQRSLLIEYDPSSIVTRLIPLGYGDGINQLDIKSVNDNINYIENTAAKSLYGVIVRQETNSDIQNAYTLMQWGNTLLSQNALPKMRVECSMVDLSVINKAKSVLLGDTVRVYNDIMSFDLYARIVSKETDLINEPWNPQVAIDTRPIRLTDQVIELSKKSVSLQNAPQGSTCIFPLMKAENADADHPVTFDLDIPKETININRVYLNIHGRKYRANSKDAAAGGSTTATSSSGGSTAVTSGSGGYQSGSSIDNETMEPTWSTTTISTQNAYPEDFGSDGQTHQHDISKNALQHTHLFGVSLPGHTHSVSIGNHTHSVTIPSHTHAAVYGIVESTYPKNVKVSVNGHDVGVSLGDGYSAFDNYDIDITALVTKGNNKIQITTEQNGRIDAIVYSQIFIQAK